MICRRRATETFGQGMSIAAPVTLLNVHAALYTGLVLVRITMTLTTAVGESLDPPGVGHTTR
jgi:ABC-type sulfate transport system permease component